jgi:hypothetical protein
VFSRLIDPTTTAVSSGEATFEEVGGIVFHPPAAEPPLVAGSTTPPTPSPVQRAQAEPVASAPTTQSERAEAASPGGQPPQDLDELAGRLYERIRHRLKAELRLDRERAGLLTDLRR